MASTPPRWYRFQKPSKKEWTLVVIALLAPLLLLGTWEVFDLPEQGIGFVLFGAVGIAVLLRLFRRGRQ